MFDIKPKMWNIRAISISLLEEFQTPNHAPIRSLINRDEMIAITNLLAMSQRPQSTDHTSEE
jgi:hypothetical protein